MSPLTRRKGGEPITNWRGHAHIGIGWAAFLGIAGDNHSHAHHAVQVVVSFGSSVTLWTSATGPQSVASAVIPSDLSHALLPSDTEVGLLYLDGESSLGRSLSQLGGQIWSPLIADAIQLRAAFQHAISGKPNGLDALLAQFTFAAPERPSDVRVARVLERLHTLPQLDATSEAVAALAHLSPSRFAHRFRQHTGMPLRPYMRWLRLQRATAAIIDGASATTAAHASGFADAAHLSRTLRRHFGITPAVLTHMSTEW